MVSSFTLNYVISYFFQLHLMLYAYYVRIFDGMCTLENFWELNIHRIFLGTKFSAEELREYFASSFLYWVLAPQDITAFQEEATSRSEMDQKSFFL